MPIGDWFSRGDEPSQEGGHPLASDRGIEEFAAGLPQSQPAAWLDEVCGGLEAAPSEGLGPRDFSRALRLLDTRAQTAVSELTRAAFRDPRGEPVSEAAVGALARYSQRVAALYARMLEEARGSRPAGEQREHVLLVACRGVYALAQRKKFARIAYRAPEPELWQSLQGLRGRIRELGLIHETTRIYPDRPDATSPHAEYLIAMMLDTVPLGALSPAQIQCLDLMLQRFARGFVYSSKPSAEAYFFVDPARPQPPQRWLPGLPIRSGTRYFGPGELQQKIAGLRDHASAELPEWATRSGCNAHAYLDLLKVLGRQWSDKPPQRRERRDSGAGEVLMVHGLEEVRRVLSAGRLVHSREASERREQRLRALREQRHFDRLRFGSVDPDKTTTGQLLKEDLVRAQRLLERLEDEEEAMAERMPIADMSESGLGVALPANARWGRVGELVAFRLPSSMQWELAITRRMVRAGARVLVGLERIRGEPTAVRAAPAADLRSAPDAFSGSEAEVDAVLVSAPRLLLVVPPGHHAGGNTLQIRDMTGTRTVRVQEAVESGRDFNIYALDPA
jgi:hypothetical protein